MKESTKDDLSLVCNIATRVISCIFLTIVFMYKIIFKENISMTINDIFGVLIIGFLAGALFYPILLYKNMGKTLMLIFRTLYFIVINAIVLIFGIKLNWFNFNSFASFACMECMIIFVYLVVTILVFTFDFREAIKINKMLQKRKNK